jgi:hypothetical protein
MLPKESRVIDNKPWKVTSADYYSTGDFPGISSKTSGWYWIVCLNNRNDIRRISISGWEDYPLYKD